MCNRRWMMVMVGIVLLAACAGGSNRAPIEERSTVGSDRYAGSRASAGPAAGAEADASDWTATVRPLGESAATSSRALPDGEVAPPSPSPPASPAPATDVASVATAPAATPGGGARQAALNPAVVSLLNAASAQSKGGDYARAAATLERAIAIEPNNAWLWHRLADTRLKEGRLEQAAGLAAKSSALGTADRALQADNWALIAEVRSRQGDSAAAAAAQAQARKLSY